MKEEIKINSETVIDFNFTKELMYQVEEYLYNNSGTRMLVDDLVISNDHTFGILIENGDWKHEHIYLDILVSDYLKSLGLKFDVFSEEVGHSYSDCYSAFHYFSINGITEPVHYDSDEDDQSVAQSAQAAANRLASPVECRGVTYYPMLESKKKPYDSINRDAGDVKYNITMFNKMNSPVTDICTNPVSGPFGRDVGGGEAMGEAVEKKETVDLKYIDLEIEVCYKRGNSSGYFDVGFGNYLPDYDKTSYVTVNYDLTLDKQVVVEALYDILSDKDLSDKEIEAYENGTLVEERFDELFDTYNDELQTYFKEEAIDEATEKHYYSYYDSRINEHIDAIDDDFDDLSAFNECNEVKITDALYGVERDSNLQIDETYLSQYDQISALKKAGLPYNFDRFTKGQIYSMYQKYIIDGEPLPNSTQRDNAINQTYVTDSEFIHNDEELVGKSVNGKFVIYQGDNIVASFDSQSDAEDAGYNMFGTIQEEFPNRTSINLDRVAIDVANLLYVDKLGEDKWIEFDYNSSHSYTDSPEVGLTFDAIGEDRSLRGSLRTNKGSIDVKLVNGSKAKCNSAEQIARFIAGEFGISL